MVSIYCIEDLNGLKYIGSTKKTLNTRLIHHRCHCNDKYRCSSYKLDLHNCKIYSLEECTEENRRFREQYWIDNTDCVNLYNTTFDRKKHDKEYYEKNKDKILQEKKEYHKKNKDKIKHRKKEYYNQNKDKLLQQIKEYRQKNKDKYSKQDKKYYQKNKDKIKAQERTNYHFKNTWGGDPRYNNNLLKIHINLFL